MKDQLSALIDGELELASSDHIITSIKSGGELKTAWKDYHLIGDALRGELSVHPRCCDKIMQALDLEPALLPTPTTLIQTINPKNPLKSSLFSSRGWSVAASVAAVMFVGLMVLQQQLSPSASEEMAPIEIANSMPLEYLRAHQSSAPSGSAYFIQDASFVEPK